MNYTITVEQKFEGILQLYRSKLKKEFLKQIRGICLDNEDFEEIFANKNSNYFLVSFDRKTNDIIFSYSNFDAMLIAVDALSGGRGIRKPVNQLRVLKWNSSDTALMHVIRILTKSDATVNYRGLMVSPISLPLVGRRLNRKLLNK